MSPQQQHQHRDGITIEDRSASRGRSGKRWLARVRDTRLQRYLSKAFHELVAAKAWAKHMRARFELAEASAGTWPVEEVLAGCVRQMRQEGKNEAYVDALERHGGLFIAAGARDLADAGLHDRVRTYLALPTHERHRRGRQDGVPSPGTVKIRFNYIRALVTYAMRFSGLRTDPLAGFVLPSQVRNGASARTSDQETYTLDELRAVLALDRRDDPVWIAFLLSIYTGLRAFELQALRWEAFDWVSRTLRVARGKGSKVRFVPLQAEIYDFMHTLGGPGAGSPRIGRVVEVPNARLQVDALRPLLELAGVTWDRGENPLTRLPRRLTWHACRRTCAAASLAAGVDSLEIQRSFGHTDLALTGEYAGSFHAWKAVVQAEAWPRGRLCFLRAHSDAKGVLVI